MDLAGLSVGWYLALSVALFAIGGVGLLVRRNPLVMFMCVELMLNAVNVAFVALGAGLNDVGGQVAVFFVLVVAATEVVIGLALVVAINRRRSGATADDVSLSEGLRMLDAAWLICAFPLAGFAVLLAAGPPPRRAPGRLVGDGWPWPAPS